MKSRQEKRRRTLVETNCAQCGLLFGARLERVKEGLGRFCSRECSTAAKRASAETFETRFWRQVAKSEGCWEWQGALLSTGYGQIWRLHEGLKSTLLAHRVSYELSVGPVPEGLFVCHRCDNRTCVRPDHLFAATQRENLADMVAKGRGIKSENSTFGRRPELVRGTANHSAVLNESQVREIRTRYNKGAVSCNDLGREFGVSATQIHRAVTGATWSHVPMETPLIRRAIGVHSAKEKRTPKTKGDRVLPDLLPDARAKLEARFWIKVEKTGDCWNWVAARDNRGYGKFGIAGVGSRDAHRVSFELANGPIPKGICVCHSCDNPSCVNPAHLFLGTQADNVADMTRKKRGTIGPKSTALRFPEKLPRGAANVSTKLMPEQVCAIRKQREQGQSLNQIARTFEVSAATVRQIVNRQTWKYLD